MFDIEHFRTRLQKHRKELGLTQNELADILNVSAQSVSYWECGKGVPDIENLCRIADVLSVSLDDLLQKSDLPLPKCLVGVDAGGTKTEFALIDEYGNRLNSVILAGCNPNTCGIKEAIQTIAQGISLLRPKVMNVVGIFIGGAGFEVGDNARQLLQALHAAYPNVRIECANDIFNVIACSARPDKCVAAICGTGCTVVSCRDGEIRRLGGLGYLFERCGSGYDLGRDAITATIWAQDGMTEPTALTRAVEEKVGGLVRDRLDLLYQENISFVAGFAPLVFRTAQQGDTVAREILDRNSRHMADMIRTALSHAPELRNVIFSGSVFAKSDLFYEMVVRQLDPELTLERMLYPPVWGACLQCAKLCGLEHQLLLENFLKQ